MVNKSLSVLHRYEDAKPQRFWGPYLTLPPGWAGSYTCPALRPYQFSPMGVPECNHKVTGNGYKAVNSYEAVNKRL